MGRILRTLAAFVLAFVMAFAPTVARAQELRETTGASAPGPEASATGLVVPQDVPVIVGAAREIPPVPSSYVTRDLGWLKLSYPPAASERVASMLRDADAVKADLVERLGQRVLDHVEVRVAPTAADMARLAPPSAPPPEYASGVAYTGMHFVLLTMLAPRGAEAVDLDEVFRHELAHVALEDAVIGKHVPVWFNEGLAIWLSNEHELDRLRTMWNATLAGTLIPLSDLDRSFPRDNAEVSIAYAESADFMRFLMRRADSARFVSMIGRVRDGDTFDRAIADAYGSDLRKLEFQWRTDAERRYSIVPVLTGGGLVWFVVIGALVLAYVRRRGRAKAILARWEREEAIEDAIAARRAVLEAQLSDENPFRRISVRPATPKVEHEGGWYTLH